MMERGSQMLAGPALPGSPGTSRWWRPGSTGSWHSSSARKEGHEQRTQDSAPKAVVTTPRDREIRIERILNASSWFSTAKRTGTACCSLAWSRV